MLRPPRLPGDGRNSARLLRLRLKPLKLLLHRFDDALDDGVSFDDVKHGSKDHWNRDHGDWLYWYQAGDRCWLLLVVSGNQNYPNFGLQLDGGDGGLDDGCDDGDGLQPRLTMMILLLSYSKMIAVNCDRSSVDRYL